MFTSVSPFPRPPSLCRTSLQLMSTPVNTLLMDSSWDFWVSQSPHHLPSSSISNKMCSRSLQPQTQTRISSCTSTNQSVSLSLMSLISCDSKATLSPVPESNGGLYLTRRGDFNVGAHISSFLRVRCKTSAPLGASQEIKALMAEKRHVTFFGKWAPCCTGVYA